MHYSERIRAARVFEGLGDVHWDIIQARCDVLRDAVLASIENALENGDQVRETCFGKSRLWPDTARFLFVKDRHEDWRYQAGHLVSRHVAFDSDLEVIPREFKRVCADCGEQWNTRFEGWDTCYTPALQFEVDEDRREVRFNPCIACANAGACYTCATTIGNTADPNATGVRAPKLLTMAEHEQHAAAGHDVRSLDLDHIPPFGMRPAVPPIEEE